MSCMNYSDNIFHKNYRDSIYTQEYEERYESDSIYSNIDFLDEKREQEEKVISDIIDFYMNKPETLELIPLPISPENFQRLKNQWNKEAKFSMSIKKKNDPLWKRIGYLLRFC